MIATPPPPPLLAAVSAMGTRFELALHPGTHLHARDARAAADEALDEILRLHRALTRFEPGGAVALLNRSAGAAPLRLDAETFHLLDLALRLRHDTLGAFSPVFRTRPAAHDALPHAADALSPPPTLALDHAARTAHLPDPNTFIDLGAIAKGFALDRAADILRAAGVTSALLHGGTSSVVAIGAPPGQSAWRIAIRAPLEPSNHRPCEPEPSLNAHLRDAALSVSALTPRPAGTAPHHAGHILDPRTGAPAAARPGAACIAPSAAEADAWSTALIVLGHPPEPPPEHLTCALASSAPSGWMIVGRRPRLFSRSPAEEQI